MRAPKAVQRLFESFADNVPQRHVKKKQADRRLHPLKELLVVQLNVERIFSDEVGFCSALDLARDASGQFILLVHGRSDQSLVSENLHHYVIARVLGNLFGSQGSTSPFHRLTGLGGRVLEFKIVLEF